MKTIFLIMILAVSTTEKCFGAYELEDRLDKEYGEPSSRSSLLKASARGDLKGVKRLCNMNGTNINAAETNGFTALHFAVNFNHYDVCEYLLSQKASVEQEDINGDNPLAYALEQGSRRVYDLLREYKVMKIQEWVQKQENDGNGSGDEDVMSDEE